MNHWPIRTAVRRGGMKYAIGTATYYRWHCDRGHEWSGTRRDAWCHICVELVAYSLEWMAAALGGRQALGDYPHLPSDRPSCGCWRRGVWSAARRCGYSRALAEGG